MNLCLMSSGPAGNGGAHGVGMGMGIGMGWDWRFADSGLHVTDQQENSA